MLYINGLWTEGEGGVFASTDPATGVAVWQGRAASEAQVASAVDAARGAFFRWRNVPYPERLALLTKVRDTISAKQEELTELISRETGKVLWDAKGEVAAVLGKFALSEAAYAERTGTRESFNEKLQTNSVLRHKPHGVMAVYGPYNFPAHLPGGHIVPALLAGNTVIFKPSELTPAVGEWLVRRYEEAGMPAGVLQLLQGERETGKALAAAEIDGLLFTGSSATGKLLHAQFAGRPEILLALEMGGNNPLVVYQPSDIAAAVRETVLSAFTSSGQRCSCARRLILPRWEGREAFLERLQQTLAALRIGVWSDKPEPFYGPLISAREAQRILDAQAGLVAMGGKLLLESQLVNKSVPSLISPGLIEVTEVSALPDEEYFGPLLQVFQVETTEQAWEVTNATRYGLSAGILTADRSVYEDAAREIQAGILNWNRNTTGASGAAPFGGVGCSGNHRPAGYYAADYCAYPVASMEVENLTLPSALEPGLVVGN